MILHENSLSFEKRVKLDNIKDYLVSLAIDRISDFNLFDDDYSCPEDFSFFLTPSEYDLLSELKDLYDNRKV